VWRRAKRPPTNTARRGECYDYIGGYGFPGSGLGVGGPKDTFDVCRAVRTLGAGAAPGAVLPRIKPIANNEMHRERES
jgi:hypothetical protein